MDTVSIVTCTARPQPQFQWLADSICASSLSAQVEIEWIVIDAMLWHDDTQRRRSLEAAVCNRISYKHIPPKPCRWQGPDRLTQSEDFYALCNARNTGLIAAEGKRVILLDDCSVVDERWLEHHLAWSDSGIAGAYCTYRSAVVESGRIVSGDFGPYGWDERKSRFPNPQPAGGAWGFGLNTSFPLQAAIEVNGFDEAYDGQGGSEDSDTGIRMERAGVRYVWDPTCTVYQILNTHDPVFEHAAWGGREGADKIKRSPKELVIRRDGKSHFANEALIERLVYDDIHRTAPLGNAFKLQALRKQYRETGSMKHEAFSEVDWRDGKLLKESDRW